jgi:septal ring factor EnvC (AmiA/AmiB activator)
MGLGSTAKKIQKVADTAEKLYAKLNEMREQMVDMRDTLETTNERVERLEAENAHQKALIEALAHEEGIDVDEVLADADQSSAGDDGEAGDESDETVEAST